MNEIIHYFNADEQGNIKSEKEVRQMSPLILAYVGDSVLDLYVSTYLAINHDASPHKIHKMSIEFVKAKSQSAIMHSIMDTLLEDELYIYKRGRNAKSGTVPKNADVTEYRTATGFEAVLGYLYLTGQSARLNFIMQTVLHKNPQKGE